MNIPTSDNWQEKLEYVASKQNFDFTITSDGYISLQKFSPEGQDFHIELEPSVNYESAMRQIADQASAYNVEEETILWYKANRGEPQSLELLLDDMKWCKKELQSLSDATQYYECFSPSDFFNDEVLTDALARSFEQANLDDYSFSKEIQLCFCNYLQDQQPEALAFVYENGCQTGVLADFIYNSDNRDFYSRHLEDIDNFINDLEEELGDRIPLDSPRYTSAVWLVIEQCAFYVSDTLENSILDSIESKCEGLSAEQVGVFLENNSNQFISDQLSLTLSNLSESKLEIIVPSSPIQATAEELLSQEKRHEGNESTLNRDQSRTTLQNDPKLKL